MGSNQEADCIILQQWQWTMTESGWRDRPTGCASSWLLERWLRRDPSVESDSGWGAWQSTDPCWRRLDTDTGHGDSETERGRCRWGKRSRGPKKPWRPVPSRNETKIKSPPLGHDCFPPHVTPERLLILGGVMRIIILEAPVATSEQGFRDTVRGSGGPKTGDLAQISPTPLRAQMPFWGQCPSQRSPTRRHVPVRILGRSLSCQIVFV